VRFVRRLDFAPAAWPSMRRLKEVTNRVTHAADNLAAKGQVHPPSKESIMPNITSNPARAFGDLRSECDRAPSSGFQWTCDRQSEIYADSPGPLPLADSKAANGRRDRRERIASQRQCEALTRWTLWRFAGLRVAWGV